MKKGDWNSLVELAKEEGHDITKEDLISEFNRQSEDIHPLSTIFNWKKDSILEDPTQMLTAEMSWTTYKQQPFLQGQMQQDCYDIILEIAKKYNIQITGGTLHNEHVNLTIRYPIHESLGSLIEE